MNGYYVNQPVFGDMFDAGYTPSESTQEYGARTCYKSVGACGSVETFLKNKILQTGHHDVIEHGWLVLKCDLSELDILRLVEKNRYLVVDTGLGIIAGNMRSWYDLNNAGFVPWAKDALVEAAPKIFCGESVSKQMDAGNWYHEKSLHPLSWKNGMLYSGHAVTTTVDLLSWADGGPYHDMRHYTFAISGFSRSASLQLVRSRSMSFSAESQRYVDLSKGDWMPIVPPSIASNADAVLAFENNFNNACRLYHRFRELGVKKEDARYVLDNSIETKIVMSGPQWAYEHFFKLRADDPAAQWEIRNIAKAMQSMMQATY